MLTGFAPLLFGSVMWPVLGLKLTFGMLALAVVAAVVWMAVAAPETKGRALDEDAEEAAAPGAKPLAADQAAL